MVTFAKVVGCFARVQSEQSEHVDGIVGMALGGRMGVALWEYLDITRSSAYPVLNVPVRHVKATGIGLVDLCLKLPALCYAPTSWKCNYYASGRSCIMFTLCSIM